MEAWREMLIPAARFLFLLCLEHLGSTHCCIHSDAANAMHWLLH